MPKRKGKAAKRGGAVKAALDAVAACLEDRDKWDSGDFDATLSATTSLLGWLDKLVAAQPPRFADGAGAGAGAGSRAGASATSETGPRPLSRVSWDDRVAAFTTWLKDSHGVDTSDTLRMGDAGEAGTGLFAVKDVPEGAPLMSVPAACMLSTETALASPLRGIIMEDELFRSVPVMTLAVHLLCERADPASRFGPYIDVLPDAATNALYMTAADFGRLRPSAAFAVAAMRFVRTTAKHYVHLHDVVHKHAKIPQVAPVFTWAWFRWAMAMVMTRQNRISVEGPNGNALALVPLWDMLNHEPGPMTTSYDESAKCLRCTAMRAFAAGEEVTMFYGPRGNDELLHFAGFVTPDNPHSETLVHAGLRGLARDPLHKIRAGVLRGAGVTGTPAPLRGDEAATDVTALPVIFSLPVGRAGLPGAELVRFLRVHFMDKAQLGASLRLGRDAGAEPVSEDNEKQARDLWAELAAQHLRDFDAEVAKTFGSVEALLTAATGAGAGAGAASAGEGEDALTGTALWATRLVLYTRGLLESAVARANSSEDVFAAAMAPEPDAEAAAAGGGSADGGRAAGAGSA